MKDQCVISTAVAPIHKEANFLSEMVTQGLMFESANIINKKDTWYNIVMEDGYEGWIHHFYMSENKLKFQNSLILSNRYTPIRTKRGKDGNILALLSFATVVPLIEKTSGYCNIELINGKTGFIPAQSDSISNCRDDIMYLAHSLMGAPYMWGGKSSFGYDCSGFVQMVLKAVGISIPRDTGQQIQSDKLKEISITDAQAGDLVYFSENGCINHVAFIAEEGKILHSSGEVKLESINEGERGFNNKLAQLNQTFISINGIIDT